MKIKLSLKFFAFIAFFGFGLTAKASSPVEIVNWYKQQYPNTVICGYIRKDIEQRREKLLVVSKNGWSIAESEAAWNECKNQELAAIPLARAKTAIEIEVKRCEPHRQRTNQKWSALAISFGRKAEADALLAKCEEDLHPQLEVKRKELAEHESNLAQKVSDEKARIDAINASIDFPNLPFSYFTQDQKRAYIAAMKSVSVEGVVSRSEFIQAAGQFGNNNFKSTWKIKVNSPRELYSRGHRLNCFQIIAGIEKSISIQNVASTKGSEFAGQLNAGTNEIDIEVLLRDDEKFPVRHLIESARCTIRSSIQ